MNPQQKNIEALLIAVRSRIKAERALAGAAVTLAVAAGSVILAGLLAHSLGPRPAILMVLRLLPLVLTVGAGWLCFVRPLRRRLSDQTLARLIEERRKLSDRLVTAVEFENENPDASPAIVERLIKDAGQHCSSVDASRVVDIRRSWAYGVVAMLVPIALALLLIGGRSPLSDGLADLFAPLIHPVSANALFINVLPGSALVPRGSDQKIKALLKGFDAESAQIFIRKKGESGWLAYPMEPDKNDGEFRYLFFSIQDSISYYIESASIRSPEFTLDVADLPFVKQLDFVLAFPSYTRLEPKRIENGGDLVALKGTTVTVSATMSGPAKAARIVLNDGTTAEMAPAPGGKFEGRFLLKQDGTYHIEVTSPDGQHYNGSSEYDINILEDHPPTVTIEKPGRDVKVTSVQEVFTQVRAEDDYGVSSVELYYSVNGGQEQHVALQDLQNDSARVLTGSHTFFLEELGLKPGDFISYYAKARDNNSAAGPQEAHSDIYFMEVRPFDRQFRQAQQQGGGQGGDEDDSSALTRRQREIVAATFRVHGEEPRYSAQEKQENYDTVRLSQEKLKVDTDTLVQRIRERLGPQLKDQPQFADLVDNLSKASTEMESATGQLGNRDAKDAMPPEQRALQQLLHAEAIFRNIQIARGSGSGGKSSSHDSENLADLFELQLDKMKNQYESVQREQQSNQSQQEDELSRRLQELARRQQQQLEQSMRSETASGGSGSGGSPRQQQQMIEEARKMARELEKLSRDRRDPKLEEAARQMQQAADQMQQAQSSGASGQSQSIANQLRALSQMEQARRTLDSAKQQGGQQGVQALRQRAEQSLKAQQEIERGLDEISKAEKPGAANNGKDAGKNEEKKEQLAEKKDALADQVSGLEKDIDQAARGLGNDKPQAGDSLRKAGDAIRQNRIPDRIRQNNQLIANGWYDQARERERTIKGNLQEVLKNLQSAEGAPSKATGEGEGLEATLDRARRLGDDLQSLQHKLESQRGQAGSEEGPDAGQQDRAGKPGADRGREGQGQSDQGAGQQKGQRQSGAQNQSGGQQSGKGQSQGRRGQQSQSGRQGESEGQATGQQGQQGQSGSQGQSQGRQGEQGEQGRQGRSGDQHQSQGQGQRGKQGQGQQSQQPQQQQQGQQGPSGSQGQSQGQSGGQSSSGQGKGGSQQSQQQGGESQGGTGEGTPTPGSAASGGQQSGDRQVDSEWHQRMNDAEELKKMLGANKELGSEDSKALGQAIDEMHHLNSNSLTSPAVIEMLKNDIIARVRQVELDLARRVQEKLGSSSGALGEGDAPDRYKKMLDDYYRRLSTRTGQPER
jgi:hypothetical protein